MRKLTLVIGLLAVGATSTSISVLRAEGTRPARPASTSSAQAGEEMSPREFLDTYCVTCHNEKRKASYANLAFDSLDMQQLSPNAATWEKAIKKLSIRAMPPAGMRRPSPEGYSG